MMRYPLSSRFRGTLLGAAIAEILASCFQARPQAGLFPVREEELGAPPFNSQVQNEPLPLNQVAQLFMENLIQFADLDLEYLNHSWIRQRARTESSPLTAAETLVGTIPVSLFFHEDEARLRQKILQATGVGKADLELQSAALAVAYAIAQGLREKLDPASLIPQTVAYLPQASEPLVKQLEQVQILVKQRVGLDAALTQLLQLQSPNALPASLSVALAFYCFLSTLEDYRLTIVRAARTGYQSPLTAILAGALSGAYNSTAGIPPGYRLTLFQQGSSQVSQQGETPETIILKLADQLLANWSGAYEPSHAPARTDSNLKPAVAAPGIIRPR